MSEPKINWEVPIQGVVHEMMSAMSSLNMEPSPLATPTGTYLSETDAWAQHAMSHLTAACQLASKAASRNARILDAIIYVLDVCHGLEEPMCVADVEMWAIEALRTVIRRARANRGKPSAEEIVRELAAINATEVPWWISDVHGKALAFVSQETGDRK